MSRIASGISSRIDGTRLLKDLHELRAIGAHRSGVHRPTYSPEDMKARHWLAARLTDAGLTPEIDGIGNVIGRADSPRGGQAGGPRGVQSGVQAGVRSGLQSGVVQSGAQSDGQAGSRTGGQTGGRGDDDGRRLLIGSHLETQPYAGWLDGAMGVIYGLEIARALGPGIDVAGWADEEGHYGSFLGSRSFCGLVDEAELDAAHNRHNGTSLRDALRQAGLAGRPRAVIDPARYLGYLEAHIEQGAELDDSGQLLGVVTSIVGARNFRIGFEGVQNHAGTTRMAVRQDAGTALVRLAAAIDRRFPHVAGPRSVWTIGRITLDPGAPSIVPGRAEMLFQFRDTDAAVLDRLSAELDALVAEAAKGPCGVTVENLSVSVPTAMDAGFQGLLARAAEHYAPGRVVQMPSGAGHDAQILAKRLPAAMLFVPSIGGISHHWAEDTKEDDIVLGCAALADAAAQILGVA